MEKQSIFSQHNQNDVFLEEEDIDAELIEDEDDADDMLLEERPLPLIKTNRFNHYHASIDAIPKLLFEDEVNYARMVQAAKGLGTNDTSSEANRIRINAQLAKQVLIEHNLRLVRSIARKYVNRGVLLDDLIQEGNIGMMEAVDKYNPEFGFRFSTYAVHNIRLKIKRYIQDQAFDIRIPNNLQDRISKIKRIKGQLTQELQRDASPTEIAVWNVIGKACFIEALESGFSISILAQSLDFGDFSPENIEDALGITKPILSLDEAISSEDDREWIETITMPEKEGLCEMDLTILKGILKQLLKVLPQREVTVLAYRYGLGGLNERTYEDIGKLIGVTRERTRQLEKEALEKLGCCPDSNLLLAFQG